MATKVRRRKQKNNNVWRNQADIVKIANSSISDTIDYIKVPELGLSEKYIHDHQKASQKKVKFNYIKAFFESFKDVFTMLLVFIAIYNYVMFGINYTTKPGDPTVWADLGGGIIVTVVILASALFDVFTNRSIFYGNVRMASKTVDYTDTLRNVLFGDNNRPIKTREQEDILIKRLTEVRNSELLVGDIIYLQEGDVVPCDCRIIRATDLMVDQEVLDGIKTPTAKKTTNSSLSMNPVSLSNIVYRGSTIVSGSCWGVIVYKGLDTLYSQKEIENIPPKEKTTFKEQVKRVTKILITTMLIFVPTIFILVAILNGVSHGGDKGFKDPEIWMDAFVFAMAIAVALSPDALPFMLNAVFARSKVVLSKKQIDVSDLSSIQNIGSMDVLAIDVDSIFANDDIAVQEYSDITGYNNHNIIKMFALLALYKPMRNEKLQNYIVNNQAYAQEIAEIKANYKFLGEVYNLNEVYLKFEDILNQRIIYLRRSNIPEAINKAAYFADDKTSLNELTEVRKKRVISGHNFVIDPYSFGINMVSVPNTPENEDMNAKIPTERICYLGHISFGPTIKSGSSSIVDAVVKEGVRPVLITDKTLNQGQAVAEELDVKVTGAMSGDEIDALTDAELMRRIKTTNLFYSISINTQIRLLKVFKKNKNVVGFLGMDVWDSIQLLVADVGITLDTSDSYGKKSASLIINHLNLMQLITAIKESRKALTNMMKYIKLKVTGVTSLTMKLVIGICIFSQEPMSATQLLVQNLIYDIVEYTIAFDKVGDNYLEKPSKWKIKSIIPFAAMNGVILITLNVINIMILVFALMPGLSWNVDNGLTVKDVYSSIRQGDGFVWNGDKDLGSQIGAKNLMALQTGYFVEDCVSHLFFVFVARGDLHQWWQERPAKLTFWALVAGVAFFVIVTVIPGVNKFFGTVCLNYWYLVLFGEMFIMMFAVDGIKDLWRKKKWQWL